MKRKYFWIIGIVALLIVVSVITLYFLPSHIREPIILFGSLTMFFGFFVIVTFISLKEHFASIDAKENEEE